MKLTKSVVDNARYEGNGKSRHVLWDTQVSGFGVRIYPTGKKSFVVFYRKGGRQRFMTLGKYGVLTVEKARALAQQALARVRLEEADPLEERRSAAKAETVEQLAERYLREHAEVKKKPDSLRNDQQMIRDHVLPALGGLRVVDVSRADVARVHHGLRERRYAANRVLSLLSKMFNLAEKWGIRADNTNPCRHVERFKEKRRERYLSGEELSRLSDVLAEVEEAGEESPHAVAAVRLLILTGCRLGEILKLRWEQVDLERGLLRLPDSKTGAKTVFLNGSASALLSSLPRTAGYDWVIEGRKENSHLTDLQRPWRRIRSRAGLEDVRLHDLRHTFASFGAGAGLSLPMIGKLLGHTQAATTERYAHLAADPMHEAANRIGAAIESAMQRTRAEQSG